jgi:predicted regulator of Ras-like GTPase activity (Roadblock/LC7/MglB family)
MILIATALPKNSNDGYVAAAYIVFFVLLLIYVAIMSVRLSRTERAVRKLREDAVERSETPGQTRERETV